MTIRETVLHRTAMSARGFVILLAFAVLPNWTFGQESPKPKSSENPAGPLQFKGSGIEFQIIPETKLDQKSHEELLKALNAQIGALIGTEDKPKADTAIAEIQAKIQELNAQLERLKAQKTLAETPKETSRPAKPGEGKQPRVIVIGSDGKQIRDAKVIWAQPEPAKPASSMPYQGIRIEFENPKGQPGFVVVPEGKGAKNPKSGLPQVKIDPIEIHFDQMKILPADVKVRESAVPANKVIALTRTTYTMPKEKAAALEAFLKEHVKTGVLEMKIAEDGLTVTTTTETQKAVESLVNLIAGPKSATFRLKFDGGAKPAP